MPIDRKKFIKTLKYSATLPPEQIIEDIAEIAAIERWARGKASQFSKVMWIAIAVAILSLFLIVVSPQIAIILSIVSVLAAIGCSIIASRYSRLTFRNSRYELLEKLLSMLSRDRKESVNFRINLVFGSATNADKLAESKPHPHRSGWRLELFRDEWLNLEGEFRDGTRFELSLAELNQKSSGWKRSASGKSKYKSKTKPKGCEIGLAFKYRKNRYGAIELLAKEAKAAIKLPPAAKMKKLNFSDRSVQLIVKGVSEMTNHSGSAYPAIAMMFLSLYQILNLARMLSKDSRESEQTRTA